MVFTYAFCKLVANKRLKKRKMKKITLLTLVLGVFFTVGTISQNKNRKPIQDQYNFVPGKIIVKLKDEVDTKTTYNALGKGTAQVNVAELLGISKKIKNSKVLFTEKTILRSVELKRKKAYDYKIKNPKTLKNIFLFELNDDKEDILSLIETLEKNKQVEYAEPNYNFSVNDFTVDSEIIYKPAKSYMATNTVTPDDPLYTQQSNIAAVKIDQVWNTYGTGDGSQTIAILDTGIDYTHPDLEPNIWINEKELNGVEGYDDDGNGFIDDIRGWDFIHSDNEPLDDNMHGTHVAGIAGAVGGNAIGIAGAAWNVKLMPIKVFQASGIGDAATIAEGVTYASENGAGILNMSFGSYAQSGTLQAALEIAYSTSILVAAAGNNGVCIGPGTGCAPFFPAAYTYVLGVEADGKYTNYDQDGPVFSLYAAQLLNYELKAPGTGIMSTIPDGGYRKLTGTSMAAPLVAGGLALYKQQKPNESQELMYGNLIKSLNGNIDFLSALTIEPTPDVKIITAIVDDQFGDNVYQDDEPDAGETIHIFPTIKNYWGPSNGVKIKLEFDGNEYQQNYFKQFITIDKDTTQTGSVSAYAVYEQNQDPLIFSISEDITHNTEIMFKLSAWDPDYPDIEPSTLNFKIKIKSAIKLQGLIENDTVLTADKEYLIDNVLILRGANLFIKPGVTIAFGKNEVTGQTGRIDLYAETIEEPSSSNNYNGVYKTAYIYALGTKDSLITLKTDSYTYSSLLRGGYTQHNHYVSNVYPQSIEEMESVTYKTDTIQKPVFTRKATEEYNIELDNSVCHYCYFDEGIKVSDFYISNSQFPYARNDNTFFYGNTSGIILFKSNVDFRYFAQDWNLYNYINMMFYTNFANYQREQRNYGQQNNQTIPPNYYDNKYNLNNVYNHSAFVQNYIDNVGWDSGLSTPTGWSPGSGFREFGGFYTGAGTLDKIKSLNVDSFNGGSGVWEYNNEQVLKPYEEAHGMVEKVLVNGFNSFDNSADLNSHPIGVGVHKIEVFFNRPMDTNYPPRISYGVRMPFTQTNVKDVDEAGSWSSDGKVYTVNHEVKIGSADGINRIRVQDARDLDGFKIPVDATRFNMLIQSAGSASTGFEAEPGLGKITLNWEEPSEDLLEDILGYNMYRYKPLTDTTYTEVTKINESLITDLNYEDFDVEEGTQYYYKYKILRTSFEETDFSQTVTTQPLTAKLGDANGDDGVNVMDLVQNVDYILGNNPKPFIFSAADVNNDDTINVLDIVGIVDIILNPSADKVVSKTNRTPNYYSTTPVGDAIFFWEGDDLYVESDHEISGLQLAFDKGFLFQFNTNLPKFESLQYQQEDYTITMLYSFGDVRIPKGKTKLLTKSATLNQEFAVEKAVVGTTNGRQLNPKYEDRSVLGINSPEQGDQSKVFTIGPNPTSGLLNIFYYLPEQMDKVRMTAFDVQGKRVWHHDGFKNTVGQSSTQVNLTGLPTGVYFLNIDVIRAGQIQKREVKRILIQR